MTPEKGAPPKKKGTGPPTARRGLVENEIYEQATRLFAEKGFAGTTLQDIADALGVTRPALYYYVKSKDELLAKLVHELTQASAEDLNAVAAGTDPPAEKLRQLAFMMSSRIASHAERFRLLVKSESELPAAIARTHNAGRRAVLAAFTTVISEGIRDGTFRPIDERTGALGILGTCNWVAWWHRPGDDIDAVARTLADMAVASISRSEHRQPRAEGLSGAIGLLREDLDHMERLIAEG